MTCDLAQSFITLCLLIKHHRFYNMYFRSGTECIIFVLRYVSYPNIWECISLYCFLFSHAIKKLSNYLPKDLSNIRNKYPPDFYIILWCIKFSIPSRNIFESAILIFEYLSLHLACFVKQAKLDFCVKIMETCDFHVFFFFFFFFFLLKIYVRKWQF